MIAASRDMIRGSCAQRWCRGWSGLRSLSQNPGHGKRQRRRFSPRAEGGGFRQNACVNRDVGGIGLSGQPDWTPDWTWAAARDAAITSVMKSMPVIFARSSDSILLASPGELSPSVVSQRRPRALRALHAVRKYYLVQRDEVSPLTALRNVVAYPCRHSSLRIGNMNTHEPPTGGHTAGRPLPVPCCGGLSLLGARSFGHPARECRGHKQPDA